jgi:hypothetical protein
MIGERDLIGGNTCASGFSMPEGGKSCFKGAGIGSGSICAGIWLGEAATNDTGAGAGDEI